MSYSYSTSGDFAAIFAIIFMVALAVYVVTAFFQMRLLKNAGHRYPVSAWVPLWQTVSLWETGGIRTPWAWVLVVVLGSAALGWIPIIGWAVAVFLWVVNLMLIGYAAKGVQAGMGVRSTGWIVVAVLFPLIWMIWAGVRSEDQPFDQDSAVKAGGSFPFTWFGPGQPMESFKPQDPYAPTAFSE